jgi:hypothetical protein
MYVTRNAAASTIVRPSVSGMRALACTRICSAIAPDIAEPHTESPTAIRSTPSPIAATRPENSLAGVNGTGTDTWYWSAMNSKSGKSTAAAFTSTITWPDVTSNAGTSRTTMSAGPPYASQRAAFILPPLGRPRHTGSGKSPRRRLINVPHDRTTVHLGLPGLNCLTSAANHLTQL